MWSFAVGIDVVGGRVGRWWLWLNEYACDTTGLRVEDVGDDNRLSQLSSGWRLIRCYWC